MEFRTRKSRIGKCWGRADRGRRGSRRVCANRRRAATGGPVRIQQPLDSHLHGGASRGRQGRLRQKLRLLPRRHAQRQRIRQRAARRHLHQQLGRPQRRRALQLHEREDAARRPGSLGAETYAQIAAFLLQSNGVQPGEKEFPTDAQTLATMTIPRGATQRSAPMMPLSPLAPPMPIVKLPDPLAKITPVTADELENPPAGEWLIWRRSYNDQGFSPLAQINKSNVADLRVKWAWSLPPGQNEATPLEHDGVLFVDAYGDHVEALNAVTGDLLWEYSRQLPKDARFAVKRDIALFGDRLFVGTSDDHVVALDVKIRRRDLGFARRRLHERISAHRRPARRQGQSDAGRRRTISRRQFHRRARYGDRQGSLALPHHRAAGPARRQLERPAQRQAQRRVRLDARQLRSAARPRVFRRRPNLRHRPRPASRPRIFE